MTSTTATGPCSCCHKGKVEWECVSTCERILDLCDKCFHQLRKIYKQHPAVERMSGKRTEMENNDLKQAIRVWFSAKQPPLEAEPDCEIAAAVAAMFNA